MKKIKEDRLIPERIPTIYELLQKMGRREQSERKEAASKFKRNNG